MKSKLIVNPVAGANEATRHLQTINARLRDAFGPLDIVITTEAGDGTTLAKTATEQGCDRLFVAGGDGTLNEILNGVAQVPGGLDAVAFGVIPLGTGNDFARALRIPLELDEALTALTRATLTAVDVAVLNETCFVNTSAGGFIAQVSLAVTPRMKSLAGTLAYVIGGAQVLLDYEPLSAQMTVTDGPAARRVQLSLHTFAVCNAPTIGGGQLIAPAAQIDDGSLDVCLFEAMPTLEFVGLMNRVSSGEHVDDERVKYFRARELEIAFDQRTAVNTDGQVRDAERCSYRVLPRAARFLAPLSAAPTGREGEP